MTTSLDLVTPTTGSRIRVFIDFWNLQLTMNQRLYKATGLSRFDFDWQKLPRWLVEEAARKCTISSPSFEGAHVYMSYDPLNPNDQGLKRWALTWLDRQPGVQVVLKERYPKDPPRCPSCHNVIAASPCCNVSLAGTVEKGVDTAIATDMIRLAWEQAYDVAVLVSSDRDLVPAVEFIDLRGRKVVQAGFPPIGADLATTCWASYDIFAGRQAFAR